MQKPVYNRQYQTSSEISVIYKVPNIEVYELQSRMTSHMSILREQGSLIELSNWLHMLPYQEINVKDITIPQLELSHLWQAAKLMTSSALLREESRGLTSAPIFLKLMSAGKEDKLSIQKRERR